MVEPYSTNRARHWRSPTAAALAGSIARRDRCSAFDSHEFYRTCRTAPFAHGHSRLARLALPRAVASRTQLWSLAGLFATPGHLTRIVARPDNGLGNGARCPAATSCTPPLGCALYRLYLGGFCQNR